MESQQEKPILNYIKALNRVAGEQNRKRRFRVEIYDDQQDRYIDMITDTLTLHNIEHSYLGHIYDKVSELEKTPNNLGIDSVMPELMFFDATFVEKLHDGTELSAIDVHDKLLKVAPQYADRVRLMVGKDILDYTPRLKEKDSENITLNPEYTRLMQPTTVVYESDRGEYQYDDKTTRDKGILMTEIILEKAKELGRHVQYQMRKRGEMSEEKFKLMERARKSLYPIFDNMSEIKGVARALSKMEPANEAERRMMELVEALGAEASYYSHSMAQYNPPLCFMKRKHETTNHPIKHKLDQLKFKVGCNAKKLGKNAVGLGEKGVSFTKNLFKKDKGDIK